MSDSNQNTDGSDIQQRMEAAKTLRKDAQAIEGALIQELSAQYESLVKQIQELDRQRQEIGFKLSCLRGEVDEPIEDFTSKRHHVKDEVILAFLVQSGTATTSDVQEYFKFSSATVCRRMDALLAAGKVTVEKNGRKKFWKAAA
jgi:predicted transcriptional regulator